MTQATLAKRLVGNQPVPQALNAFISRATSTGLPLGGESDISGDENSDALSESPIRGRVIALKDNICTTDQPTTCASQLLDGFCSPYDATVALKIRDAGAFIMGKTNMDEFGMGSDSTHSYYGPVLNRYSRNGEALSAGGSSGGSAVAVAAKECHAALGTDTGGSIRLPAAYNGLVGFKPSYGMVSRWGVVAYANSLDTVGVIARKVSQVENIFGVIRGFDPKDPTSIDPKTRSRISQQLERHHSKAKRSGGQSLRIGVPKEYNTAELQPVVRQAWRRTLQSLQEQGHMIHAISLPTTRMALSAYYILAPAEASSNLAKFDGARYGNKKIKEDGAGEVLYATTRGNRFGKEVKRRILLGSYSLSAAAIDNYFIKAQKVRRLVQRDFNNAFALQHPLLEHGRNDSIEVATVDFVLTPTAQSLPPRLKEIQHRRHVDAYSDDVLTVPASLAGLPAVNVPVSISPDQGDENCLYRVGMQVIGQYGDDDEVLSMAKTIELMNSE